MQRVKTVAMLLCMVLLMFPYSAGAEGSAPLDPNTPSQENLAKLKAKIDADSTDFDSWFAYGEMASALGKFEEAENAFLYMLSIDPKLYRVKLDLGLLYQRMGRYKVAKRIYKEVLKSNPPEGVKKTIEKVLMAVDDVLKIHRFTASFSTGFNRDSNATSAASTGENTFLGGSFPLDPSSKAKRDAQVFGSATLSHVYRFDLSEKGNLLANWNSSLVVYRSEQANQDQLDLRVYAFKTGPSAVFKKQNVRASLLGGYSTIYLDGYEYLNVISFEPSITKVLGDRVSVTASGLFEDRKFLNSPEVTTYRDRRGEAYQAKLAGQMMLDKDNILSSDITYRREEAMVDYYDNDQVNIGGGYTRMFEHDYFFNALGNLKTSRYDGADPLVSSDVRSDDEKGASLTVGKKFDKDVTATLGYQYKNVESNIQNFEYVNHRFMSSITWNFDLN